MNKQSLIEERLKKPFEVGDYVVVKMDYETNDLVKKGKKFVTETTSKSFSAGAKIVKIEHVESLGELIDVEFHSQSLPYQVRFDYKQLENTGLSTSSTVNSKYVTQSTDDCGANPFKPKRDINFTASNIESLLFKGGYGRRSDNYQKMEVKTVGDHPNDTDIKEQTFGGINFNPHVIDEMGNKVYFQRDLIWTLEEKQLLISSIYNGIEIGKFIFRHRPWVYMRSQMEQGEHAYDFDCVDGKQRYNAILEFVQDKFPDDFGNYWHDLSTQAQRTFLNINNLACGVLDETATDNEVIETFLAINFTGVPMSKEHIEFVQAIKLRNGN